jgi:hypothetical protein
MPRAHRTQHPAPTLHDRPWIPKALTHPVAEIILAAPYLTNWQHHAPSRCLACRSTISTDEPEYRSTTLKNDSPPLCQTCAIALNTAAEDPDTLYQLARDLQHEQALRLHP